MAEMDIQFKRESRPARTICLLTIAVLGVAPMLLTGCPGRNSHPKEPAAAFLKETLAQYAARPSDMVDCDWTATDGKDTFEAKRTICYQAPNRYNVNDLHDNTLVLASVSDGAQVTEWSNVPGMMAGVYPAPANLAAADSPQMTNPLDCGSPLYAFFAGVDGYGKLVDDLGPAPHYGPTVDIDGDQCVTVIFDEPGSVGQVSAVISVKNKVVRKLTYNAANLLAKGRGTETESAPSSGAPPFHKSLPENPSKLTVTEVYQNDPKVAELDNSYFDTSLPSTMPAFRVAQDNGPGGASSPGGDDDFGKPPVPIGSTAPDISVVDAGTGKTTKLSDYRGQVVVLDFFASWCMPCRASLPETQSIHAKYGGRGLTVMGIDGESRSKISEFLKGSHYTFPAYTDRDASAARAYKANAIPTIAIVDKNGNLSFYAVGPQEKSTMDAELKKVGLS